MKKTAIASVALAAALFAVSCQKETNPVQNESGPMTISAVAEGLNSPTKTQMIFKYDVAWSANDKIYVVDAQGNHDTFKLETGAGTTKGTFTQEGQVSFTGEVQAYYPATMLEGGSPLWPASQTNDQTIPMYCKKTLSGTTDERMDFASLGSVLQIVFTTSAENIILKSIEIKDGEKTMSGEFTVNNGIAEITAADNAGITLDLGEGVAVGLSAKYFNISVPSGNYEDLTLIFTAKDGKKCEMTGGKVNIAYNTVGRLTLTGKEFKIPGVLSGVFTVGPNATDKVHFSQGNLWYDGSNFNFEANQYDFRTYAGKKSCIDGTSSDNGTPTGHWGLFGWSTNATNYGMSTSEENSVYSGDFKDWGKAIGDGNTWRTLTKDEWTYLFNSRTDAASKVGYATVGGVNGIIILPDSFTDPKKNNGSSAFVPKSSTGWTQNVYTSGDNWNAMETAGAVFLPAAGARVGSDVGNVGNDGFYWSSTAFGSNIAYSVYFNSLDVSPDTNFYRQYGFSVRLITECQ